MAGIYIHIPFCAQKCHYCDFYSLASTKHRDKVIHSIQNELELRNNFLINNRIETIYLGGGTPSLISVKELNKLILTIEENYECIPDAEITLEANPEDLTETYLLALSKSKVNRLSIGIQSLYDDLLYKMNRRHNAEDGLNAVKRAQKHGFHNISIDLIYGFEELTKEKWMESLSKIVELNVQHISAYHLSIEENTAFGFFKRKGKIKELDEELSAMQFNLLLDKLEKAGFVQYEISNFARNNLISKHNSNYWRQIPYLGVGPSAHSFDGKNRYWNKKGLQEYISSIASGSIPFVKEELSSTDKYNDYIITGLRTIWGIDEAYIKANFEQKHWQHFKKVVEKAMNSSLLLKKSTTYILSRKAQLISDAIMADLFYID